SCHPFDPSSVFLRRLPASARGTWSAVRMVPSANRVGDAAWHTRYESAYPSIQQGTSGAALILPIRYQHDLADHASAAQELVCVPRLAERQPLRDQRLDPLLPKQVEECEQVVAEPGGSPPHQPLDAEWHHGLPARPKPVPEDVPSQDGGLTNRVPPARRA